MTKLLSLVLALLCAPVILSASQPANPTTGQEATAAASQGTDLAVVRDRFVHAVLPVGDSAIEQVNAASRKYAAALQTDGSWSDINYTDAARSVWVNADHLNRMLVMAKSARLARNGGHPDEALEGKILLALKWWTDHDYRNPNWWWNEIGVPELAGEIGSLLGPQLPDDARAKIVAIMKRSDWHKWTGANLTWGVGIEIVRGCLENDPASVAEGFERMYQEIKIMPQPEEGIEQDYSFHQHRVQLYNGGYGLDFANDVGRFVSFSWGTRFQIPADRMALFSAYLLDGEQWMIRGNVFDYSAVGREITRPGKVVVPADKTAGPVTPVGPAYSLGNVMSLLAAEPTPRQKELQSFAARLLGKPGAAEFVGNKMFWCSDFMTHRRAGYYTSVRMMSTRMLNSELVNSEGRKSVHLSDGTNYLYLTGDEYKDIFGVWDWTKIPGTTAIQGTLDTGEKNAINLRGTTTFDGGVSDGAYGMAAMDLARGKLVAKKTWFFFDSSYVALGAGITLADDKEHAVATDVNQPLLVGDVMTSEGKGLDSTGVQTFDDALRVWIYHNHVGYIFAPHTKINLSAGPQTGAWSEIGTGSSTPVTVPVFNLWIDHGVAPQAGSYEYTVVPGATSAEVAKQAAHSDVEVLANTASTQAVYNSALKLAEIAFREAGSLVTPLGKVEADHFCLLLVKQVGNGWKVTASNPENQPLTLHVTVKGKQVAIELPSGNFAGSSVSVEVR
ncbi:MAG TPA: polysaccharide lyase family 8 super-sandwich domain-containing protein [Terracidiphilus sp.]|nr:polysaccharide lyase family 8 super-sandwich domain-containing protein [Terracidiphilus sp.]